PAGRIGEPGGGDRYHAGVAHGRFVSRRRAVAGSGEEHAAVRSHCDVLDGKGGPAGPLAGQETAVDERPGRVDSIGDTATFAILVLVIVPLNEERRVAEGYDAPALTVEDRTQAEFAPLGDQVGREAGGDG